MRLRVTRARIMCRFGVVEKQLNVEIVWHRRSYKLGEA